MKKLLLVFLPARNLSAYSPKDNFEFFDAAAMAFLYVSTHGFAKITASKSEFHIKTTRISYGDNF